MCIYINTCVNIFHRFNFFIFRHPLFQKRHFSSEKITEIQLNIVLSDDFYVLIRDYL